MVPIDVPPSGPDADDRVAQPCQSAISGEWADVMKRAVARLG
jgi:hypothetical protein